MPQSTSTTQQPPSPAPQPWPDGVIARYLTDAGKALADPTVTVDIHGTPDDIGLHVVCRACPWESTSFGPFGEGLTKKYKARAAADDAHRSAQAHAEKCRALPRPAATR